MVEISVGYDPGARPLLASVTQGSAGDWGFVRGRLGLTFVCWRCHWSVTLAPAPTWDYTGPALRCACDEWADLRAWREHFGLLAELAEGLP